MFVAPSAAPAVITGFLFTSIAFIIVVLRMISRAVVVKNVGADDYLIAVSMVASIAFLGAVMYQIQSGLGRMILFEELPDFLKSLWTTVITYGVALNFCKVSITVQCYRVFRTSYAQKFLRVYFVVIVLLGLWAFFSSLFNCWPIETYWERARGAKGVCMDSNGLSFTNAGVNIVTDLVLVILPMVLLGKLQIAKRQKHILLGVFGVGLIACIASIIRLHSLYTITHAPLPEQPVQGVSIAIWSGIEINIAISCASIAALRPLVSKLFPKLMLSDLYARSRPAYYAGNGSRPPHTGASAVRHGDTSPETNKNEGIINVVQSFEMHSSPKSDGEGKISRDGSEKALVTAAWQADCYAAEGRKTPGKERDADMA